MFRFALGANTVSKVTPKSKFIERPMKQTLVSCLCCTRRPSPHPWAPHPHLRTRTRLSSCSINRQSCVRRRWRHRNFLCPVIWNAENDFLVDSHTAKRLILNIQQKFCFSARNIEVQCTTSIRLHMHSNVVAHQSNGQHRACEPATTGQTDAFSTTQIDDSFDLLEWWVRACGNFGHRADSEHFVFFRP